VPLDVPTSRKRVADSGTSAEGTTPRMAVLNTVSNFGPYTRTHAAGFSSTMAFCQASGVSCAVKSERPMASR
jgi:hypothetical protein